MEHHQTVKKLIALMGLPLLLGMATAHADGPELGEGSWVCRNKSDNLVRWSRGVDLFVMDDETALSPAPYSGPYSAIVDQIKARLQSAEPDLSARVNVALSNLNYFKPGTPNVSFTNDMFSLPNFGVSFSGSGSLDCGANLMRSYRGGVETGSLSCSGSVSGTATPIAITFPIIPNISDCADGILANSRNSVENSSVSIIPYETAVSYDDEKVSSIHIQQGIWNAFSETDKAAAVVHVAIDSVLRNQYGATDSVLAREISEVLFSKETIDSTGQRILILLSTTPSRPTDDGTGYVMSLQSGVYTASDGTKMNVNVDPTTQTFTTWFSVFPIETSSYGGNPRYNGLYTDALDRNITNQDCSKFPAYNCPTVTDYETHLTALSSNSLLYSKMQWKLTGPLMSDLGTFTVGSSYATDIIMPKPVTINGTTLPAVPITYPEVIHAGPSSMGIVSATSDGGWVVQLSGNPLGSPAAPVATTPEDGYSPTISTVRSGSGLNTPVSVTLKQVVGPLYVASQPVTISLRNGTACTINPILHVRLDTDVEGNHGATLMLEGWPQWVSQLEPVQTCQKSGIFGHKKCITTMTEKITTCVQLDALTLTQAALDQILNGGDWMSPSSQSYLPRVHVSL